MRRRSAVSIMLFFLVMSLEAEEELPFPLPVAAEYIQEDFTEQERLFLTRMLLTELSGNDGLLVVWTVSGSYRTESMRLGLPGFLEIEFEKEEEAYVYRAAYRRAGDLKVLFVQANRDAIQSVYRNPARLFRPLRNALLETLPVLIEEELQGDPVKLYRALLKIKAPEGATISLSGPAGRERMFVEDAAGTELVLPAPAIYEVAVSSPKHFPETFTVSLPLSGAEAVLVPKSAKAHFIDFYLADGNVPGFSWGYRLGKMRRWFLKGGGFSYLLTIIPMVEDQNQNYGFFYSTPLSVFDLQGGIRFGEGIGRLRFYTSVGVFIRLVHSPNFFGFDPIGPGGVISTLGMEIRSGRRLSFFGEWTPSLYITSNIDELRRFYSVAALSLPFPSSLDALLALDHFRAGLRIQF